MTTLHPVAKVGLVFAMRRSLMLRNSDNRLRIREFPPILREFFPLKLPAAELDTHSPRALTDFTFSDGSGRNLTLEHFRGTLILVNVWATWCAPCKEEMASLNHLALLFENKNIKFVPISIDVSGAINRAVFLRKARLE